MPKVLGKPDGKKVKKRVGVRFTVFALSQCDMPQDFEALPLEGQKP